MAVFFEPNITYSNTFKVSLGIGGCWMVAAIAVNEMRNALLLVSSVSIYLGR